MLSTILPREIHIRVHLDTAIISEVKNELRKRITFDDQNIFYELLFLRLKIDSQNKKNDAI
jgi:hypothetical protein